jgi:hypothetical protein
VFVDGVVVADAAPAPVGVSAEDWNSSAIAVATIGFDALAGTRWAVPSSVSQRAGDIWRGPDAPTHNVPTAPAATPAPAPVPEAAE